MRGQFRQGGCFLWAAILLLPAAACAQPAGGGETRTITDSGTWYNAAWSIGIFFALLAVLGKLAWKPVLRALEQRARSVADMLAQAESRRKEGEELLAKYRRQMAGAEADAARTMEQAQRQAEQARQEILQAARQQAQELARRTSEELESARQAALDDLSAFGAELATTAARRIIHRELTGEDHSRLIAESLEQIRREARKAT